MVISLERKTQYLTIRAWPNLEVQSYPSEIASINCMSLGTKSSFHFHFSRKPRPEMKRPSRQKHQKMEPETMLGINASPHPLHLALSANNKMALDWITKHSTNYHVHYRHRKSKMELDDDLDKYNFEVRKHEQATFNWNQINDETRNAWKMESLQYLKTQLVSQQTESTNKIISNSFTTLAIALYADLNDIWVSRITGGKEEMATKWPRLNYVRNHLD